MLLKLKLFFLKNKCKISFSLISLLFLALVLKGGTIYLENKKEVIPRSISFIDSQDIFSDSTPYTIKEGKDGERIATYKIEKNGSKSLYSVKILKESEPETKVKGTLLYDNYKVQINNNILDYITSVTNKKYKELNNYYIGFSQVDLSDTIKNWKSYINLKGNFILEKSEPMYSYNSSKAIVKNILKGKYSDRIERKDKNTLEIYSIYDSKIDEFKIINPEYISLYFNKKTTEETKVIKGTLKYSSHNLQLKINKILLKFPNKILINISAITSKNIKFNRVLVKLLKEDNLIYKEKKAITDFNSNIYWGKTLFRKKQAYKISFWYEISFNDKNFSTIYDKIMDNGNLDVSKLSLEITPINDDDVSLDYPTYKFKL